jgi:RNA polymerase sigma-B factor
MAVTQRTHEYQELAPLFRQLVDATASESQRRTIRDRLVTEHLPVAEHIARRFRNRGQPTEDLTQVATVGLINAVDRFDPDRGTDFLSFAVPTITGEVRRYFRDATWAIRVPRRLKELHASVTVASATLGQRLGRSARPSELADELDIPVQQVREGLQVGYAYRGESLDDGSDDDGTGTTTDARIGVIDHALTAVEDRETLHPALARLPEREASIVMMRFFGNMTQTQIADRIGVSQMHVSRLLATSLATLRASIVDGEESEAT